MSAKSNNNSTNKLIKALQKYGFIPELQEDLGAVGVGGVGVLGRGGVGLVGRGGVGPIIFRFAGAHCPESIRGRKVQGMGWQPDVPDMNDFTLSEISSALKSRAKKDNERIKRIKKKVSEAVIPKALLEAGEKKLPPYYYDNLQFCSPIEDQGRLGSCTAQAVTSMMEFVQRKGTQRIHVELSRLFLYKVTRKLLDLTGDTGAYIRSTIQAARVFGVPPEQNYPYIIDKFEDEPSAFLYAYASNFKALRYVRIDETFSSGKDTRVLLQQVLNEGYAAAFGFPVYSSMGNDGEVPFPKYGDENLGGHAVLAVGYDDTYRFTTGEKGAVIFQNSWGLDWGYGGFGLIPYDYFDYGLAMDIWAIFNQEWVNLKELTGEN